MPAPVVVAEVVLDAIKARLDLINGVNYNTNPSKRVGVPRDAIAQGTGEQLYVAHSSSETLHDEAAGTHKERATYVVWCVSTDTVNGQRKALRLVRDVQKAVRSGFAALETAGANGPALTGYMRDERAEEITGATAYSFGITADWYVDLTV
jgi:hypothetical protein